MNTFTRSALIYNRVPLFVVPGCLLCIILLLTLSPAHPEDMSFTLFEGADKVVHAILFGSLSCAILIDFLRRAFPSRIFSPFILAAIISTAFGGIVELLQDLMDVGRSADWADLFADFIGALILPLAFIAIIREIAANSGVAIVHRSSSSAVPAQIKRIYHDSFPPEERRDWTAQIKKLEDSHSNMSLSLIFWSGKSVGFITWWNFDAFVYVEHFAIDASCRGGGIGRKAILKFLEQTRKPVVLEVEPPSMGDTARRRIDFYTRCGFVAHPDFHYIQPPYAPNLPALPLMLMTAGQLPHLASVANILHREVYGASVCDTVSID